MSSDKRITRGPRVEFGISAALAALTLLVYWPSFHYPFVNYDDPSYVSQNRHVQAGLTADGVRWAFTTLECGHWHPLTWLSLQLDRELYGGLNAGGFHLTNVLLHAANAVLLFLVLARMTGAHGRSAVAAALFALHPLHVESVAWVSERKDMLSTLFGLLALAAYVHYARRPGVRRYLLVVLALALGLMAKPMLVTLPCVLLLLDWWPLRRWRRGPEPASDVPLPPAASLGRLLLEKLPLFALAGASCAVAVLAQMRGQAVASFEAFPPAARVGNALLAYAGYLGKTLWPMHLAVRYPHPGPAVPVARALAAGLLLVVLTVLALGPGRRWPYLAVGWLWFLGTLVPVIGLVQIGAQAMADRYTYLPLIGLFLALTWGAADLMTARHLPRPYLTATAAVVLSACAVLSRVQEGYWKSTLDMWEHAAAVTENNVLAHVNLGACYYEERRITDAKREFEKAAAIDPNIAEPHVNLGNIFAELGLRERAVAEYRKAIGLAPQLAGPHFNLGNVLAETGQTEEAMAEYHRAIALDPENAGPHNNLGIVLAGLGRREEAMAEFRRAIALDPEVSHPHTNLGDALREEGRLEEALAEYRQALERGDERARPRLQACERLLALRRRLADLVAGRDRPADNVERLAFAELCRQPGERRYALAVRLYGDAFTADPKLAGDPRTAHRFRAAAAAAAAGCGQDVANLDEAEKARLRLRAREWLRADLDFWTKQAQSDAPQARAAARQVLRTWQRDADLAGVRDPAALAKLTDEERREWQKLWREVETALIRASSPQKGP